MSGRKIALQGLAGAGAMWAVLIGYALLRHGTYWPRAVPPVPPREGFPGRPGMSAAEGWENLALLGCIVTFLLLKAWAMARRTRQIDALGVSLIAANVAFAWTYLYVMGTTLFAWQTTAWDRRLLLRYPLVIVLLVGAVLLCRITDEPEPEAIAEQPQIAPDDRLVFEGPDRRLGPRDRRRGERA